MSILIFKVKQSLLISCKEKIKISKINTMLCGYNNMNTKTGSSDMKKKMLKQHIKDEKGTRKNKKRIVLLLQEDKSSH